MADYRDLIKRLVEFGVPLNERSLFQGGALNTLLINGSNDFNGASKFIQDQMVFMVSDLVAGGADLTQSINETSDPVLYFCQYNACSSYPRHCSSDYLYAIMRRNVLYDDQRAIYKMLSQCQQPEKLLKMEIISQKCALGGHQDFAFF
ncbi:hypothetical protein N7533_008971 [Penicillium manginii]|uniref:uncharacterized protein n=1 Tax=Penicillium manginii TaxID=203109 RepID=UPI002547C58C|nr:uncharacterized protein N7533_008971 [Penicillium manginii]KAJ5744101.1 hypothetical protein N7533_008971 [Penicillium manginii]